MDRVLLLTDSLALPREKPEKCMFEETWPFLLKETAYEVHQVSIGGATSGQLLGQCNYHKHIKPDIVIVQVGIVDCAPRFVSKKEKFLLKKIPFIGQLALNQLNRPTIRRLRSLTYTKINQFNDNMESIASFFSENAKVFFIEIVGGENYNSILPSVSKNIADYNEVLKAIKGTNYIQYYKTGITMSDYHHLNKQGHRILFKNVLSKLK